MTVRMRRQRVLRGRLFAVDGCPGAYAPGSSTITDEGTICAARLACGPDAAVAGLHAEHLWDLRPPWVDPPGRPVSVVVPRSCSRSPAAARVLRLDLRQDQWTLRDGIRVLTVPALVLVTARTGDLWRVERLVDRAISERRPSLPALRREVDRAGRRKGARLLRELLAAGDRYAAMTRSELEELFLALLRRAGLRLPEMDVVEAGVLVDALFRRERVAVALDGTAWHRTGRRQHLDRTEELRLRAAGFLVLRYAARQVAEEPEAVVADLVRELSARTPSRP
jgi:very-short-patch-repair endonuclease